MEAPLRERPQISLGSGLLMEIFQRFTHVQSDIVDAFAGHLETSESMKGGKCE